MTIKQKILDALDATLDDLDEDRLLQMLLDAYAQKKLRIASLEQQPTGEYFFRHRRPTGADTNFDQRFVVRIAGGNVSMFERCNSYDVAIQQMSLGDFNK